jgi:hypothetical protein
MGDKPDKQGFDRKKFQVLVSLKVFLGLGVFNFLFKCFLLSVFVNRSFFLSDDGLRIYGLRFFSPLQSQLGSLLLLLLFPD